MNARRRHAAPLALALAALIAVAACAGSGGAPAGRATAASTPAASVSGPPLPTPGAVDTPASTTTAPPSSPSPGPPAVALTQGWATASLVDAATGETFRIADLAGKVVIVETMAIWCSNCRAQQGDVQTALGQLPPDGVVYVVLDIDPNEDGASLAAYQLDNGFKGRYAVAGPDVARALAAEFGDRFLNPPSTPMLIIGADGTVTRTKFGNKSPDQIVALARAHGA